MLPGHTGSVLTGSRALGSAQVVDNQSRKWIRGRQQRGDCTQTDRHRETTNMETADTVGLLSEGATASHCTSPNLKSSTKVKLKQVFSSV